MRISAQRGFTIITHAVAVGVFPFRGIVRESVLAVHHPVVISICKNHGAELGKKVLWLIRAGTLDIVYFGFLFTRLYGGSYIQGRSDGTRCVVTGYI